MFNDTISNLIRNIKYVENSTDQMIQFNPEMTLLKREVEQL